MTQTAQNSFHAAQVTAVLVSDDAQRLEMLPKYFKGHFLAVESAVYSYMNFITEEYEGGFWEYHELSNGGFFMAPRATQKYNIVVPSNGHHCTLSAEAAGITACLFALSNLSFAPNTDHIASLYHLLHDYACVHPEAGSILWAID